MVSMLKWIQEAEKELIGKFGEDYRRYMRKVPRINLFIGTFRFVKRRREN